MIIWLPPIKYIEAVLIWHGRGVKLISATIKNYLSDLKTYLITKNIKGC